jgi:peptide-methionine (S)-S-oxide reductase
MNNSDIRDPLFREAVETIDSGDLPALGQLLRTHPQLLSQRLDFPDEGYFKHPYVLWFVADNPIRHEKIPANIVEITSVLIEAARKNAEDCFQRQIDYTLALVATGRIARESGVQNEWLDLLIDAGARPGNGIDALAHGNMEAARHLIKRGGKLTLAAAICFELTNDIKRLSKEATQVDKQIALMAAAFYGKPEMIKYLIGLPVDVNAYLEPSSGFHSHASALHQAVFSGSLQSVQLLVEAGADLNAVDRIYEGTPLGWAKYMQTVEASEEKKRKYKEIEVYLSNRLNGTR